MINPITKILMFMKKDGEMIKKKFYFKIRKKIGKNKKMKMMKINIMVIKLFKLILEIEKLMLEVVGKEKRVDGKRIILLMIGIQMHGEIIQIPVDRKFFFFCSFFPFSDGEFL